MKGLISSTALRTSSIDMDGLETPSETIVLSEVHNSERSAKTSHSLPKRSLVSWENEFLRKTVLLRLPRRAIKAVTFLLGK